jgi:eukaryotic-like serine/threonine-protein kinase
VTPERWQQIKVILDEALEQEQPERAGFIATACQGDEELRREVESLVASEAEIGDFIETPVFRIRLDEVEPLAVGERIGAWQIVREIGRGGMGAVYLAERADEEFEQRVAIKVVRRGMDTDEIVRRFRSERQILAHLDHPNIAKLFDGGTTADGRPYFVMEYVEGRPIDDFCAERKLSVRERLELFRQVCAAVHFAHQNLIVHRDLKPGNILVTADGVPKLLDFGIAKLLDPTQDGLALTRTELRPMTPEYASPEQVRGEPITTASDVYSLGVLLYLLLTGQRPYRPTTDPQALVDAICKTEPLRPSTAIARGEEIPDRDTKLLRRQVAGDLDNIVLMAMRKEPQRRYASVDQLSNDIERHLEGLPVVARKDTLGYRTRKFMGRHKVGVSLAAAALLLIVGFSIMATLLWQRAEKARKREQAFSSFLVELFSVSDPSRSRGASITAQEVLDRGVRQMNQSFTTQPEIRADLMNTMGRVYLDLGIWDRAKQLYEVALNLHRKTLREDDPRIADDLHNLASVLRSLGKDADAEPLVREALNLQRQKGDTKNIEYARGLTNLAAILEAKGDLDQAETLYEDSLAIKQKLPNVGQLDIAISLNNLGKLAETRGHYTASEKYYRDSLAIRRSLAGGHPDPDVAIALNNLASLLQDKGDLAGAEAAYREALDIRRQVYHSPSPKVAFSLSNLGYLLQARGNLAGAESCQREAISIADQTLERDHPNRAVYLRNLASVLVARGKAAEAEPLAREAFATLRAKTPKSWRVADAESVLGGCLAALGRYPEAEPLLLQSYLTLQRDKGDGAKHATEARQRIVNLYTAWGKPERLAAYQARL